MMALVFFALVLILTFCPCARAQSTRNILKENLGSDFIQLVLEMSSEMKKLKEEHAELRRVVQDFAGNHAELKIKNSQRREQSRLKREEYKQALASDLREEFIDIVEELGRFKADLKMIHGAQKDYSSIKEQIKSIQHEQDMMRVVQNKLLMTQKELILLVLNGDSKNVQLNGHIKKSFRSSAEEFISIIDPTAQRQDEKEKEPDQKDEAEMELEDDHNNKSKDRIDGGHRHKNDSKTERRCGRKKETEDRKDPMTGIMQSERTNVKHSAYANGNKGMIRKSASIYTAFTARVSNDLIHFANDKPIVFDNIYLNLGNGYDRNSGIFRAPVAGLYIVLMTISSVGYNTPDVELVKNGSPLCRAVVYTLSAATGPALGSPCNVLVQLGVGDEVWARDLLHKEGSVIRGQYYSTFSMTLVVSDQTSGSSS